MATLQQVRKDATNCDLVSSTAAGEANRDGFGNGSTKPSALTS